MEFDTLKTTYTLLDKIVSTLSLIGPTEEADLIDILGCSRERFLKAVYNDLRLSVDKGLRNEWTSIDRTYWSRQ